MRKLTEEEKESIEGAIMEHEAFKFLENIYNDKSSGADGFTADFFFIVWPDLKHFVYEQK